jgi:hypothetical protein
MQKLFVEDPTYARFSNLSIKEWLAACWNKSEHVYGQTEEQLAKKIARTTGEKWSADQVSTAFSFLSLAENTIGGDTGIIRRIQREDPAELAITEALDQRLCLISVKLNELATGRIGYDWRGSYLVPRHHLLHALAVGDSQWAQRLADYDYARAPKEFYGDEDWAILAAYRRNLDAIRGHLPRGRISKDDQWRWDCLRGIAANDSEQVRAALQKELDHNRSSRASMESSGLRHRQPRCPRLLPPVRACLSRARIQVRRAPRVPLGRRVPQLG